MLVFLIRGELKRILNKSSASHKIGLEKQNQNYQINGKETKIEEFEVRGGGLLHDPINGRSFNKKSLQCAAL